MTDLMFRTRLTPLVFGMILAVAVVFAAAPLPAQDLARVHHGRGRIMILMVWDGLRPDLVTQSDTPNLFRMAREGVRFDRQHAIFPTITMVNATALATGAPPGVNGLEGNVFYLAAAPVVGDGSPAGSSQPAGSQATSTILKQSKGQMVSAEGAKAIVDLNGPNGFKGRLLGLDTIAQEVEREGGYIAVVGKQGPTAVFDNRVESVVDGKDSLGQPHRDYLFVSDDMAEPASEAERIKSAMPPESLMSGVYDSQRDLYFARLVVENALPAAKRAAEAGRPALIVFWQHNPDLTQHVAGLGTMPAMEALSLSDNNLMRIRASIDSLGIGGSTDLMVVSDHGFATIKFRIVLSEMLVSAGVKKSHDSTDIIVAPNGGADLIYLSPADFPTMESRRAVLQKIVDFAEAQEWCGPIFSREAARQVEETGRRGRRRSGSKPYLGWIDGTFSQRVVGLYNAARSPDLVISFREEPNSDNKSLTGPGNPAFLIGQIGQVSTRNKSAALVHPVKGVMYADTGTGNTFTTGMGMHGAAGEREIHNFCAAVGPDFRRGFVDLNPTANIDVAPTITQILGILPNIGPGGIVPTGRPMTEALSDGRRPAGGSHTQTMTTDRMLQGVEAVTTIRVTFVGDEAYLDDSAIEHKPLGSSP
jgi:hypothetical protein